ncbi:MAG: hypothetical protein Edafosvirus43_6, partial [Edafosvirus sp.]
MDTNKVLLTNYANDIDQFVTKYNSLINKVNTLKQTYNDVEKKYNNAIENNKLLQKYISKPNKSNIKQTAGNISSDQLINVVDVTTS